MEPTERIISDATEEIRKRLEWVAGRMPSDARPADLLFAKAYVIYGILNSTRPMIGSEHNFIDHDNLIPQARIGDHQVPFVIEAYEFGQRVDCVVEIDREPDAKRDQGSVAAGCLVVHLQADDLQANPIACLRKVYSLVRVERLRRLASPPMSQAS